jgi:membrane protein
MLSSIGNVVTETYSSWRAHRTIRLGAGLAYYGLFAIVPLMSISLAVAGIVLDDVDLEASLTNVIGDIVQGDAAAVSSAISRSLDDSTITSNLGLIGLVSLLLAASLVFVALQDAFDTVWEEPVRTGTWASLRRRLIAFAVVLLTGAALVASVSVQTASSIIRNLVPGNTGLVNAVADVLASVGSWALLTVVVASLFHFLTASPSRFRVALVGGVVTAIALTIGTRLFGEYLKRFGSSSVAGATGSVLLGLVWFYAIAQIILAGAELTRTLELRRHRDDGIDRTRDPIGAPDSPS